MGTALSLCREMFPPKSTFSVEDIPDLEGKVIIVTGGNTGVGKEIIKGLLQHNATVYLAARNPSKAMEAIEELAVSTGKKARFLQLDLSELSSIKESAREFTENEKELHVLINNAGVMMTPIDQVTKDGYDLQFGTNVLGHFYFTKLLLPVLLSTAKTAGHARVITVASNAGLMTDSIKFDTLKDGPARKKLSTTGLYIQSKFANLVDASELARQYGDQGIVSISLNPGALKSDLSRHVDSLIQRAILKIISYPVPFGALTPLYAATHPDGANWNGKFFVPWARKGELSKSALNPQLGRDLWAWMEEQIDAFK
ncbi:NAD(P)-binding protein [Rickenella mellea]|uniref:NAD(P)-binding protein n=1 Tax=Rickenella mellea TaxID=50990 RepID=A0A4Y7QH59_9AGAM|nr:NAD(P)-binding protein [Rickenella mellea]